ncbi:hypothetical protein Taro_007181 [Colocasia esculenta]|uniref:Uncharacterized protein n=1 Tax=Colocasia esculenta TaxID=4460 RepID=A0A843TUE0_COLES|nr:hypothetical protein [Colocasia esculenta]
MGDVCRAEPFRDNRVASRKAEEAGRGGVYSPESLIHLKRPSVSVVCRVHAAICNLITSSHRLISPPPTSSAALRRFQAAAWLESMVGPLGLSSQPSEMEFVSCLRNGLVLCNLINKIQPGAVHKVISNQSSRLNFEIQPPPAYQYFENIRNFLVAVEDLNLPAFEASDLERDTLESGSTTKIVDCILSLKSFHEWKMYNGGIGPCKFVKSPAISNKFYMHTTSSKSDICRSLNMVTDPKKQETTHETPNSEDLLIRMLSEQVFDFKENIDHNIMHAVLNGISRCRWCHGKVHCNHWQIVKAHEKELGDLKTMLSRAKNDILSLQCQLQSDLMQLGSQIQGLSVAALGYSKAMKENRDLYNLLQDLKGNIRVYCRIRPSSNTEAKSAIDLIGDDGSLVIMNPLKMKGDSRKAFQFNKVFGSTATQEEVYRDTQSLIRSVMDGYNVCIFAYGQTGSGKTHTMFGPSNGSSKDLGINYLALNDLFEISCIRNDVIKYEVHVQMVEIYNDQLLCP